MSSYKNAVQTQIITAGNLAGNLNSTIVSTENLVYMTIQFNIGAGATGTFAIQGSIDHTQDPQGNVINAGNFVAIPGTSTFTQPTGSASHQLVTLPPISVPYVRVTYTFGSGTGTANVYFSGFSS